MLNDVKYYEAGLRKLGLWEPAYEYVESFAVADSSEPPPDLRQDPAFAWRVLKAGRFMVEPGHFVNGWHCGLRHWEQDCHGDTLADALYTAVCALGREQG